MDQNRSGNGGENRRADRGFLGRGRPERGLRAGRSAQHRPPGRGAQRRGPGRRGRALARRARREIKSAAPHWGRDRGHARVAGGGERAGAVPRPGRGRGGEGESERERESSSRVSVVRGRRRPGRSLPAASPTTSTNGTPTRSIPPAAPTRWSSSIPTSPSGVPTILARAEHGSPRGNGLDDHRAIGHRQVGLHQAHGRAALSRRRRCARARPSRCRTCPTTTCSTCARSSGCCSRTAPCSAR